MPSPVKYFHSNMQGAPQLTNAWGDMVAVLDACLVTGFNTKTVTSLTSAAGIATAGIAAGHLFEVGQVISVNGASQSEYNGEVRVLSVTTNALTYPITGTPVSPATGTISAKAAPLGFEIAFTGTNKRVYRSANPQSNKPYLRVDNSLDPAYTTTYAKKAKVTMAEGMSGIDTFVGARAPFDAALPTKNEVGTGSGGSVVDGWHKWYYARNTGGSGDSTAPEVFDRNWVLVGDDRGFYLFNELGLGYRGRGGYCFTDFESFRQGDAFNSLMCATDANVGANSAPAGLYTDASNWFPKSMEFTGKVLMRDHTQVGGNQRVGFVSLNTNNTALVSGYDGNIPWPNPADYGLILHPIYLNQEGSKGLRGKLPGIMWVHNVQPLADMVVVDNVVGYPGRKFLIVKMAYASSGNVACMALDITGPWW